MIDKIVRTGGPVRLSFDINGEDPDKPLQARVKIAGIATSADMPRIMERSGSSGNNPAAVSMRSALLQITTSSDEVDFFSNKDPV